MYVKWEKNFALARVIYFAFIKIVDEWNRRVRVRREFVSYSSCRILNYVNFSFAWNSVALASFRSILRVFQRDARLESARAPGLAAKLKLTVEKARMKMRLKNEQQSGSSFEQWLRKT